MNIECMDFWKDKECKECQSKNKVRELIIGDISVPLCREYRKKLQDLLILNVKVDILDEEIMNDLLKD